MRRTVRFAGILLNDYVKIGKIKNSILPSRDNFSKVVPLNNGSMYNGHRYEEREISVEIGLNTVNLADYNKLVRKLASLLHTDNPSQLIIDEGKTTYYAVLDGNTDLEKVIHTGKTTLKFICHDPLEYDLQYSSIMMDKQRTFRFNNMGTYNSYPILGFKFTKPTSFIFLTNEIGEALMVGTRKNETLPSEPERLRLIDDYCRDSSTFTNGGNTTVSDNRVVAGNYGVGNSGESIVATSYGNDVEGKWTGPTFRKNINKNLDQFEARVSFSFSSQGRNFYPLQKYDLIRVSRKSGVYIHTDQNDESTVLGIIPYGVDLTIQYMGEYGFCKVYYEGKTGWINTKYVWRINVKNNYYRANDEPEYADDQMGLLEAVGYDNAGQILFRFHIRDDNKYFEHVRPEVYIKDKLYLTAGHEVPTPNTINEKDDQGKPLGEKPIASGVFGSWNDFTGTFAIRRKKLYDGTYRWWARISRTEDGSNISQEIHMGPGVIDDRLPKGPLNNIVFYVAKYSGATPVSMMAVNHVAVIDISKEDGEPEKEVNRQIFEEGDYLELDFEKCEIRLNGEDYLDKLDDGSQFFSVEKGSRILVRSDDEGLTGTCSYRKRYL